MYYYNLLAQHWSFKNEILVNITESNMGKCGYRKQWCNWCLEYNMFPYTSNATKTTKPLLENMFCKSLILNWLLSPAITSLFVVIMIITAWCCSNHCRAVYDFKKHVALKVILQHFARYKRHCIKCFCPNMHACKTILRHMTNCCQMHLPHCLWNDL